jgi:protein-disulfide isomerase
MSVLRHLKPTLDIASTLLVIVAASILIWQMTVGRRTAAPKLPVVDVHDSVAPAFITNVQGRGRVVILEFSDFECPFCSGYARTTYPAVKRSLIDSGEARYATLHFPLERIHPRALKAAEAAECAAQQGKYWEMHDRLFVDVNALELSAFPAHAAALGLDWARFSHCLDSGETLDRIRAQRTEGARLGVNGTPAFFVGTLRADGGVDVVKRINGAASEEVLKSQVAALSPRTAGWR